MLVDSASNGIGLEIWDPLLGYLEDHYRGNTTYLV